MLRIEPVHIKDLAQKAVDGVRMLASHCGHASAHQRKVHPVRERVAINQAQIGHIRS